MDDPIINGRLSIMTPEYRELALGEFAEITADIFGSERNIHEQKKVVLENGIRLYLLAFLDLNDLEDFIGTECGLSPEAARQLTETIRSSLPPGVEKGLDEAYRALTPPVPGVTPQPATGVATSNPPQEASTQQPVATQPVTAKPELSSTPLTSATTPPQTHQNTESVVKPLRTMAADVDNIHGYGAYRKMFPDDEEDEKVVHATSQDDVLGAGRKDQ